MSTKVKGLLKGLRYISQIFDEKEDEIQIGFPTDVKHVAHIGSDDPSANAPSWMTEFKGGKEGQSGITIDTEMLEENDKNSSNSKGNSKSRNIPRSRHNSIEGENKQKHTRRHQRTSDPTADSSLNESSNSSRHRRPRRGSNHGAESSSQELPPKTNRRRSKNSEDGSVKKGSSRRSSKGDSLTDISISDFGSESGPRAQ